jgi:hypothetical protein
MYYRHHATRLLALCAITLLALAAPQTTARAQYAIDYVIQPYKPGIWDSLLFGINNHGQSTGYVTTGTLDRLDPNLNNFVQNIAIYRAGDIQVLETGSMIRGLENFETTGLAINDRGDVAGTVDPLNNFDTLPVFFAAGGKQIPIVTPGEDTFTVMGLNDTPKVLTLGVPSGSTTLSERYGLWNPKGFRPLAVLDPLYPALFPPDPNDFNSGPSLSTFDQGVTNLNNADQFAAGVREFFFDPMDPNNPDDDVFTDTFLYAYVFNGRNGYSLLQPLMPGDVIMPVEIDNKGVVFGWTGNHLALWNLDGTLKFVFPDPGTGLLNNGEFGRPTVQRNERGQVVAITPDGGVVRYSPKSGVWTNITASIQGLGPGPFFSIRGFNDRGQFVGEFFLMPPQTFGFWGFVVSPTPDNDGDD